MKTNISIPSTVINQGELTTSNILHILIGVAGIICNILILIVTLQFSNSKSSRINLFILNQTVVDLITCVWLIIFGLALEASAYYGVFGEILCRFWSPGANFPLFSCFAISTYNMIAMCIERYVAVIHHLQYKQVFNKTNTRLIILIVWIVAPLGQYIFPAFKKSATRNGQCGIQSSWTDTLGTFFGVFLFLWEFLLPCAIMTYSYVVIVRKFGKSEPAAAAAPSVSGNEGRETRRNNTSESRRRSASKNLTFTVFTLFLVYIVCWTPNQITFLQFNLGGWLDFNGGWYHFTVFLAFCNTFSNFFVYALKQRSFQHGLRKLLLCRKPVQGEQSLDHSPSIVLD